MSNLAQKIESQAITIDVSANGIEQYNKQLETLSPIERIEWALEHLPGQHIVSSSFGAQSSVMLHLLTQVYPNIPIVLTDTGYLFKETYQFIETLTESLKLNLQVYRAPISSSWQEAKYGKLWEQGVEGIEKYNQLNKVEPMKTALHELKAGTWFAGLRRSQSQSRQALSVLQKQQGQFKFHPIIDQSNRELHQYMTKHKLPYHPLWEQGFVSIGDWHTTKRLEEGMTEEETRFFGLKRECGLHEFGDGDGI